MAERWQDRFSRAEFKNNPAANASFKGIPFIVKSARAEFGRRVAVHEYPLQDIPLTEDLGRKARVFSLEGALLGGDYLDQRDRLIAVCEEGTIGELIHPYYGNLQVRSQGISINEDSAENRILRFTLSVVETGQFTFPSATLDTTGAVSDQVDVSLASLKSPFEKAYDIATLPLIFTSGALQGLQQAWDAIEKVKKIVDVGPTFLRDLEAARASAGALVVSGSAVFDSIVKFITFGLLNDENRNENINEKDSYKSLIDLLSFQVSVDNSSQKTDSQSFLVQDAAAITMALNSSRISFDSANEAREFRQIILAKLDEIFLRGTTDDVTQQLSKLQALVSEDINSRAINLPELKVIQPRKTQPALVLSQTLYGTSDKSEDIVTRNQIEHPGFVPGGVDLEVVLSA